MKKRRSPEARRAPPFLPGAKLRCVLLLVLSGAACGRSDAALESLQNSRDGQLGAAVDSLFAPYDAPFTPGGVVAVIFRGEIAHLRGYGAANREFDVPWTSRTRYRVASVTKSFTAHAGLALERAGLLDLDDEIRDHLPDFPRFESPLRLRHLLTMTSGLWQDEVLLSLLGIHGPVSLDRLYELSRRQGHLNYAPGAGHNYIDTNFRVFARVIESVTGRSYPDAMTELVFGPLGMDRTLSSPDIGQIYDSQATTYMGPGEGPGGAPLRLEFPYQASGDGSIITTMDDMIRWLLHLREGFETGESLFDRMKGPVELSSGWKSDYGLGVYAVRHRGLVGWGHGGATGTHWVFYPEIDLMVAVFVNNLAEISKTDMLGRVTDAFLRSHMNPDPSILSPANPLREQRYGRSPAPLPPEDAERLTGLFVDPTEGFMLESKQVDGRLVHDFIGARVAFRKVSDCRYESVPGEGVPPLWAKVADCEASEPTSLLVRQAGWKEARPFMRAERGGASGSVLKRQYAGHYYSRRFGVHWRVVETESGLRLIVGGGGDLEQAIELQPVAPDVFAGRPAETELMGLLAPPPMSVRFERNPTDGITRLIMSTDRIRGLIFERESASMDAVRSENLPGDHD